LLEFGIAADEDPRWSGQLSWRTRFMHHAAP
jgi:hypothetical protein